MVEGFFSRCWGSDKFRTKERNIEVGGTTLDQNEIYKTIILNPIQW